MVTMVAIIIAFLLGGLFGFITYGLCYVCGKNEEEEKHYSVLYLCDHKQCTCDEKDQVPGCNKKYEGTPEECKYTTDIFHARNFKCECRDEGGPIYFTEIERENKINEDEDGKEHCSIIENPQDVINPDKVTNILGFSND